MLGACGYYRSFIQDFGTRTRCLTQLLKKDADFDWTEERQAEFEDIKTALTEAPILALPRWDLPFILRTDASEHGMGGLLVQMIEGVR